MLQRTPEWFAARCGKLGSSSIADMMARTKTGWGASRANLKARLVVERLTGATVEAYVNGAMQHGIDTEGQARAAYEFHADVTVVEVGWIEHPSIAMSGASPDGLVGDDGLIEIKCPQPAAHIDLLLTEVIPDRYVKQMLWQMACTGRAWCDFVSFCPMLPAEMQILIRRVKRDATLIAELEREAQIFLREVDDTIEKLTAKFRAVRHAAE
jgi:putative phage-type endonuclease